MAEQIFCARLHATGLLDATGFGRRSGEQLGLLQRRLLQRRFGQHHVDAFVQIDKLRDVHVGGDAAERISVGGGKAGRAESFKHRILGRLFFRLDAINLAIDVVVADGQSFEEITVPREPFDERGLAGKLFRQFVRNVRRLGQATQDRGNRNAKKDRLKLKDEIARLLTREERRM